MRPVKDQVLEVAEKMIDFAISEGVTIRGGEHYEDEEFKVWLHLDIWRKPKPKGIEQGVE